MAKEQRFKTYDGRWGSGKVHRYLYDPVNRVRYVPCRSLAKQFAGEKLDNDRETVTCKMCDPSYEEPVIEAPEPGTDFRMLVCGSRTYSDYKFLKRILDLIKAEKLIAKAEGKIFVVIQGAAPGADSMGKQWADENGLYCESYPADWKAFGKRAGYLRNQQMLDEGKPDIVVAFVDKPLEESRGTNMMVNLAKKANIDTLVYYDGST